MYKEILQNIDNIQIWPVISFVIFFLFFIVLLWWTFSVDKGFIRQMSELPLEDGTPNSVQPSKTSSL
jgi:cytochrome c oxidase cbb3-type subunit 4